MADHLGDGRLMADDHERVMLVFEPGGQFEVIGRIGVGREPGVDLRMRRERLRGLQGALRRTGNHPQLPFMLMRERAYPARALDGLGMPARGQHARQIAARVEVLGLGVPP